MTWSWSAADLPAWPPSAKQLAADKGQEIGVCVLEKGAELGAHTLSGASWIRWPDRAHPRLEGKGAPLTVPVTQDKFMFLSETGARVTPTGCCRLFPQRRQLHRPPGRGGQVDGRTGRGAGRGHLPRLRRGRSAVRRTGRRARATGDMGVARDGAPPTTTSPAWSCTRVIRCSPKAARPAGPPADRALQARRRPQRPVYGIGIKEMWEVDPAQSKPGLVIPHRRLPAGRRHLRRFLPLSPGQQPGGGRPDRRPGLRQPVAVTLRRVPALQTHPAIAAPSRRQAHRHGARAITAGGLLALPKLTVPGGVLVGCEAGFLNASRIRAAMPPSRPACWPPTPRSTRCRADRRQDELSYPAAFSPRGCTRN